jgi:putative hemolysin
MATHHRYVSAFAVAIFLSACGGEAPIPGSNLGSSPGSSPSVSEDERGSVGLPPGAPMYCAKLGFSLVDGQCVFPDGTACNAWAFYRGECGQSHSYCNQHGGTVSSKTKVTGTLTTADAVCDLNGVECTEANFLKTGKCQ